MPSLRRLPVALVLAIAAPACTAADCPEHGLTGIASVTAPDPGVPTDREVTVRGVVTGDFRGEHRLEGFYLQSPEGRGDPPAGVFIYAPDSERGEAPVAPGREVVVTAHTDRFHGRRQLNRVERVTGCGEPGLPEPVELPLPETERDRWQRYAGVLVTPREPMTVTSNHDLARYGSLLLASGGRLFKPHNTPGGPEDDPAGRRLVLDDARYARDPHAVPYLDDDNTRRVGSVAEKLRGVLTRAFDAWRLHPLDPGAVRWRAANPRSEAPDRAGTVRVAALNVENYFTTLGERGAADRAQLDAQRGRLEAAAAGLDADLLALSEVENDPGAAADLAERLGAAAGVEGGYRSFDLDAALGEHPIRVMLAWNPGRVELVEGPFVDDHSAHRRPPVAGYFRLGPDDPGTLVVAIHHKSKGDCPASGDIDRGQGCWNDLRVSQSKALARFTEELSDRLGTERVLILGDINAYGGEQPVTVLREAGLTDLVRDRLAPSERYTYVHDGRSGYLDTALASPALAEAVAGVHIWHINADEPAALHRFAVGTKGPWRSSDHDPVVVDLHTPKGE